MTKEELISELKMLPRKYVGDPDRAHFAADTLLLVYINDPDVSALHDRIAEWTA